MGWVVPASKSLNTFDASALGRYLRLIDKLKLLAPKGIIEVLIGQLEAD